MPNMEYREVSPEQVLHFNGIPVSVKDGKVGTHPANWPIIEEWSRLESEPSRKRSGQTDTGSA